jgi:hypothetical protein
MDVFDLFAKLSLDTSEYEEKLGQAASDGRSFLQNAGGALGTAAKVTGAAVAASATAVAGLAAQAVNAYASYEQLAGGIETLFGTGGMGLEEYAASIGKTANEAAEEYASLMQVQELVMNNADMAFKTAGMSANDYMDTAIQSAAAMINSLDGDTARAAELVDMSITDMADNANKMGTSMEALQNAYRGFSRGNFTMLDNLALGFSGTKEGMEELLAKAQELSGVEYNIDSYADIVEAIHVVQTEMGITGTTAKEASGTIQGSLSSLKASWENLVAGFANPDSDLGELINNFIQAGSTALDNLMPTIIDALSGIAEALPQVVGAIVDLLPTLISDTFPLLLESAIMIVNKLVEALPTILQALIEALPMAIELIVNTLLTQLPTLIDVAAQAILTLADGLIQALPDLIPAIVDIILTIVDKLTDPDMLVLLIEAAIQLIIALAEGLIKALPKLIEKVPKIIANLVEAIIRAAPELLKAALELVLMLAGGIVDSLDKLVDKGKEIVDAVKDGFMEKVEAAKTWGKDMIDNFISGIKEKWEKLKSTVTDLASTIKSLLGFSEPEVGPLSNFHTYAPDMMDLFAQGIKDNENMLYNTVADAFDFQGMIVGKTPILASTGMGGGTGDNSMMGTVVELLSIIANKDIVELSPNEDSLFDIIRKKNTEFTRMNGDSAFA